MYKKPYNLSKTAQYLAQELGIEPSMGNEEPPQVPEDNDNDGRNFEPDENMARKIAEWAKTKGCQEVGQDVLPMALSIPPNIDIVVKVNPQNATLFRLKGTATIRFIHELSDHIPQWSSIANSIRSRLLQSSLWNYLGVPYEDGFFYLQNTTFTEFVMISILQSCLYNKKNEIAFWAYENADKYVGRVKESIANELRNTNTDIESLQIQQMPQQASGKNFWRTDTVVLMSSMQFSFAVKPWKFEQKTNQGAFLSLAPQLQKAIILDIAEILETLSSQIETQRTLNAEIYLVGKEYAATTDRLEERPEVNEIEFVPDPIEIYYPISELSSLSTMASENLEQIFSSIPTVLLHINNEHVSIPATINSRDEAGMTGQRVSVDTRLLVDHIEVAGDKIKLLIVPIEQDIDW